jgi:MFS family permease
MLAWFAPLLRERGFEPGLAAAAAGLTALVEIPVLLLAGRIGERWGWRAPLVWGAALYTVPVGILAMPLDLPMPFLVALRASTGVAFGLFMTGAVVMVRELVPPRLVATGQGVLQLVIFGVSPAIAGILGGLLWPLIGSATLGLFAVGGAAAAVVARLSLPAGHQIHHDRGDRGVEPAVFEPAA